MSHKNATVIVSKCYRNTKGEWCSSGSSIANEACLGIEAAHIVGNTYRASGILVIVRPEYNEINDHGQSYFREWRSWDGSEFQEYRWCDVFEIKAAG